jgi:hypothetical protein
MKVLWIRELKGDEGREKSKAHFYVFGKDLPLLVMIHYVKWFEQVR